MTTVTVDDPTKVVTKRVGANGQLYVGKEFADKEIEIVIASVRDSDSKSKTKTKSNQSESKHSEGNGQ